MKIAAILTGAVILLFGQTWPARYNGTASGIDQANSVALDSAGNVYVTGTSDGSGSYADFATVKYSDAGVPQWTARYNAPDNLYDYAGGMALDGDQLYVAGGSMNANVYLDYLTVKYDVATGDTVWTARYNAPADYDDQAYAAAADAAGNVYVTGYTTGAGTGLDLTTVKYDAAGTEQWVRTYSTADDDYGIAAVTDAGGHVYVLGSSGNIYFETWDYVVIKYTAAGDTAWVRRYNGPADGLDEAAAIAVDQAGYVYVTGSSLGSGSGQDYLTVKYTPAGDTAWTARYNGPGNGGDWPEGIAVDAAGNVYVTGGSAGASLDWDYATVKYTPSGSEEWVKRYAGAAAGHDEATAVALDNAGGIYVTGSSAGTGTGADYATIKYNAAGLERWVERYDGPASQDDAGRAIAVFYDECLYVTGESYGTGTDLDYATLKYQCVGVEEGAPSKTTRPGMLACIAPNPARRAVTFELRLPELRLVSLRLYDASGRLVRTIMDGEPASGSRAAGLDAGSLDPGVYFVKLTAVSAGDGVQEETGKLVIVR